MTVKLARSVRTTDQTTHTHTYNTDSREKKLAIPGLLAVSTVFAYYHTAILFSHDTLEANRLHV